MSVILAKKIKNEIGFDFDDEDFEDILLNGGEKQKNEIFHLISNKRFGIDVD